MRKGLRHRFERRFRLETGVERQRPRKRLILSPFQFVGLAPNNPAVAVRKAPGQHHLDRGLIERGIEKAAIGFGDEAVPNRLLGRRTLVGDVELGDLDRQTKASNFAEKPPQNGSREGRPVSAR